MKKLSIISVLFTIAVLVFLFTGCTEEDSGLSIEERIKAFVSDLNDSNRDGIFKEHFHPDSNSYSGDESDVHAAFPNGATYIQTSITGSGSSRSVYIDSSDNSVDASYTFKHERRRRG